MSEPKKMHKRKSADPSAGSSSGPGTIEGDKRNKVSLWARSTFDEKKVMAMLKSTQSICDSLQTETKKKMGLVFCGTTSAGKSSLVQALIRLSVSPIKASACTGFVVETRVLDSSSNEKTKKYTLQYYSTPGAIGTLFGLQTIEKTLTTDNPEEISSDLLKSFEPFVENPSFTKKCVISYRDDDAFNITMEDLPGPRNGTTEEDYLQRLVGNLVVVLNPEEPDVLSGRIMASVTQKVEKSKTRILLVFTHADSLLQREKESPEEYRGRIESFMRDVTRAKTSMGSALCCTALVQCIDPKKHTSTSYEHHRTAERRTLDKLYNSCDTPEIFDAWGIEKLREKVVGMYLATWKTGFVNSAKQELTEEIKKREADISALSQSISPASQASRILEKLISNAFALRDMENGLKEVILSNVIGYCDTLTDRIPKEEEPQSRWPWNFGGPSDTDLDVLKQNLAMQLASEVVASLNNHAEYVVSKQGEIFKNFLLTCISDYSKTNRHLHKEIVGIWEEYFEGLKKKFVARVSSAVKNSSLFMKQPTKGVLFDMIESATFPESKLSASVTGKRVMTLIRVPVMGLLLELAMFFNAHILCEFPNHLNNKLAHLTDAIKGAEEEEISKLKNEVKPLKEALSTLDIALKQLPKI